MRRNLEVSVKDVYVAILMLGTVSMLGDIVYESGRSIAPDYMLFLGASALLVGTVSGIGEFLGYAGRLVSGSLADRTKAYWLFIFSGYSLILAIPFIGFTSYIELVIVLLLLERLGKALRSPSRDAIISILSKNLGPGRAFGLHEAIDQVGAIIGPLLFGVVLFFTVNSYPIAFGMLLIPFTLMVLTLFFTYKKVSKNIKFEVENDENIKTRFTRHGFWIYCLAVFLNTAGLIPVALILFSGSLILHPLGQAWMVSLLYVIVQTVDAPTALLSGRLFDRLGIKFLAIPFILAIFPVIFLSFGSLIGVVVACVVLGFVLGMQESIYQAAVCEFASPYRRGTAYGIFNTILGLGTLLSGIIFGFFLEGGYSAIVVVGFALLLQVCALITLFLIKDN
ncbi:MAG: MFS transporter [Candidatus Bathyarchaeota archaeon]|nr:MFS transporter [Candidatus Bathyarchaeota archaeon]